MQWQSCRPVRRGPTGRIGRQQGTKFLKMAIWCKHLLTQSQGKDVGPEACFLVEGLKSNYFYRLILFYRPLVAICLLVEIAQD